MCCDMPTSALYVRSQYNCQLLCTKATLRSDIWQHAHHTCAARTQQRHAHLEQEQEGTDPASARMPTMSVTCAPRAVACLPLRLRPARTIGHWRMQRLLITGLQGCTPELAIVPKHGQMSLLMQQRTHARVLVNCYSCSMRSQRMQQAQSRDVAVSSMPSGTSAGQRCGLSHPSHPVQPMIKHTSTGSRAPSPLRRLGVYQSLDTLL